MGYYLLAGLGAIITGIGYYIIYEPIKTRRFVSNVTWEVTKVISDITEKLGIDTNTNNRNYNSDFEMDFAADVEEISDDKEIINIRNTFVKYYNLKNNSSHNIPYSDKESLEDEKENMDVIFLKTRKGSEIFYYRIEKEDLNNLDKIKFERVEKLFLQIELIDKSSENLEAIDIHHNLDKFYLKGNKILDTNFLKWYLSYFYKMELPENYELRIFDKDINLFDLGKINYIVITEDSYNKL